MIDSFNNKLTLLKTIYFGDRSDMHEDFFVQRDKGARQVNFPPKKILKNQLQTKIYRPRVRVRANNDS